MTPAKSIRRVAAALPAAGCALLFALVAALWVRPPLRGWVVFAVVAVVGAGIRAAVFTPSERPRVAMPPVPPPPERPPPVELARRGGGGIDVLLLWDRRSGRVWVHVLHISSGRSFTVDATPSNALDVFNHPFAYA